MQDYFLNLETLLLSKEVRASEYELSRLLDDDFLEYGSSLERYMIKISYSKDFQAQSFLRYIFQNFLSLKYQKTLYKLVLGRKKKQELASELLFGKNIEKIIGRGHFIKELLFYNLYFYDIKRSY